MRIRIAADGSLRLPREITEKLGWGTGNHLEVSLDRETVRLTKVEVDPFAEALKKPDEGAFEKILKKQKKSQQEAFEAFEERVKKGDFPEPRPEDHPDYWR
jgi:hypothetical protein